LLFSALRFCAALGITALTVWGGVLAYRHATTADYFALGDLQIEGGHRLTAEEIAEFADLEQGMNIFAVNTDAVAGRLERHPWIVGATARRRLPSTVKIEVVEREAEALAIFDVPYLVDDAGEVFKRWAVGDPTPTPVLTGFTREQLTVDEEAVVAGIRDAISLARRYRASGIENVARLAEIHREPDGSFSLTVGDDPFYIRFGKGPYRRKLGRLALLLRRMRRDGERPAMIFFDNQVRPDRVTVKVKSPTDSSATEPLEVSRAEKEKTRSKI
jgi:cell division protein FtsQ